MSNFKKNNFSTDTSGEKNIEEILELFDGGGEVLFARSHTGDQRVKVRYGLLNLRIKRYTVSYRTAVKIKDAISIRLGVQPRFVSAGLERVEH
jgi:hypothetical protein